MNRRIFGAAVAFAAATLVTNNAFAGEKVVEKKTEKKQIKCAGMNECKGKGACGAADGSHACAGKNECKGKGWNMSDTEAACTKAKGTVVKEEKKVEKTIEKKS